MKVNDDTLIYNDLIFYSLNPQGQKVKEESSRFYFENFVSSMHASFDSHNVSY